MFIKSVIVELRKRGTFMGSKQNEKVSTVIERFTMKHKLPGSQKSANYPLKLLIAYFELNW